MASSQPIVIGDVAIDTTRFSPVHRLTSYEPGHVYSVVKTYVTAVATTYVPLLVAALLGPLPVATRTAAVKLPFFFDWNMAFACLVTFPCALTFTMTDQAALAAALQRIQQDGILVVSASAAGELKAKWERRFGNVNRVALGAAGIVSVLLVIFNTLAYSTEGVGFWVAITGDVRSIVLAVIFLYCICLIYSMNLIYICRSVAMTLFLNDVVSKAQLQMLPFHPDKCGGLRPVGRFGLRNQYLLTILGVNIAFLVIVTVRFLTAPSALIGLVVGAGAVYAFLGPIVFVGPLLSFRGAMLRTKTELSSEVAQRLRVELQRLRKELPAGQLLAEDEELIDRLRKVGGVIDELPVWPFDAATVRSFLAAYGAPLAGAIIYPWLHRIWDAIRAALNQ